MDLPVAKDIKPRVSDDPVVRVKLAPKRNDRTRKQPKAKPTLQRPITVALGLDGRRILTARIPQGSAGIKYRQLRAIEIGSTDEHALQGMRALKIKREDELVFSITPVHGCELTLDGQVAGKATVTFRSNGRVEALV